MLPRARRGTGTVKRQTGPCDLCPGLEAPLWEKSNQVRLDILGQIELSGTTCVKPLVSGSSSVCFERRNVRPASKESWGKAHSVGGRERNPRDMVLFCNSIRVAAINRSCGDAA